MTGADTDHRPAPATRRSNVADPLDALLTKRSTVNACSGATLRQYSGKGHFIGAGRCATVEIPNLANTKRSGALVCKEV